MDDEAQSTPERKSAADERKATAFHEAGHAVMAMILGRSIEKVTIAPANIHTGGQRLGACKIQKGRTKSSNDEVEDQILFLLAGMVAESHYTGCYDPGSASKDLSMVERTLANRARNERHLEKLVTRGLYKTDHLLAGDVAAKAIEFVAADVLKRETISGRAVRQLFQQAEQQFS